jgi:TPR repeat protein
MRTRLAIRKLIVGVATLVITSPNGVSGAQDQDGLTLRCEPNRGQILPFEPIRVRVVIENSSTDVVEFNDGGVFLECRRLSEGPPASWTPYASHATGGLPIRVSRRLGPGDTFSWIRVIGYNHRVYRNGQWISEHAFAEPGRYEIRALLRRDFVSSASMIEVVRPVSEQDRKAVELIRTSGIHRELTYYDGGPLDPAVQRGLEELRGNHPKSRYADRATLVIAIMFWKGPRETRDPNKAAEILRTVADSKGSVCRLEALHHLGQLALQTGEDVEATLKRIEECLTTSDPHAETYLQGTRNALKNRMPPGQPPLRPEDFAGKLIRTVEDGDGLVLGVEAPTELDGPWLPVWLAVSLGNGSDRPSTLPKPPAFKLYVRKAGGEGSWTKFVDLREGDDVLGLPGRPLSFQSRERKVWTRWIVSDLDGRHLLSEPGDYEIKCKAGGLELESNVAKVRVRAPSEADAVTLERLVSAGLGPHLGSRPGRTASFSAERTKLIKEELAKAGNSLYATYLRLGLALALKIGGGAEGRIAEARQEAKSLLEEVAARQDAAGAEACYELATWTGTSASDRNRFLREALKRSPPPGLTWWIQQHLKDR